MDAALTATHVAALAAIGGVIAYARQSTKFNNGWTALSVLVGSALVSLAINEGVVGKFGIEALLGLPVVLGAVEAMNMGGEHTPLLPKNNTN